VKVRLAVFALFHTWFRKDLKMEEKLKMANFKLDFFYSEALGADTVYHVMQYLWEKRIVCKTCISFLSTNFVWSIFLLPSYCNRKGQWVIPRLVSLM
jgi:hypothetical protein